jgi:hypothetical protein
VPIEFVRPLQLDTRPIFTRGDTPCQAIDAATARLIPGLPLILMVPFEPVPLCAKLGRQGFTPQAKQQANGSWEVEFRKAT